MKEKTYLKLTGFVFFVIAILHIARIYYEWIAVIGGVEIPIWASYVASLISIYLSYRAFQLTK